MQVSIRLVQLLVASGRGKASTISVSLAGEVLVVPAPVLLVVPVDRVEMVVVAGLVLLVVVLEAPVALVPLGKVGVTVVTAATVRLEAALLPPEMVGLAAVEEMGEQDPLEATEAPAEMAEHPQALVMEVRAAMAGPGAVAVTELPVE